MLCLYPYTEFIRLLSLIIPFLSLFHFSQPLPGKAEAVPESAAGDDVLAGGRAGRHLSRRGREDQSSDRGPLPEQQAGLGTDSG